MIPVGKSAECNRWVFLAALIGSVVVASLLAFAQAPTQRGDEPVRSWAAKNSTSTATTATSTTTTATNEEDVCTASIGVGTLVVGSVLTVGIFASYLPQHVAIVRARSSEGVSLFMLLLSNLSSLTIVVYSVMSEWDTYSCCVFVDAGQCQRLLLQLYQLLVGFVNLVPMYGLAIWYHPGSPRNNARPVRFSSSSLSSDSTGPAYSPLSNSAPLGMANKLVDVASDMSLAGNGPSSPAHRVYVEEDLVAWQHKRVAYIRDFVVYLLYNVVMVVVLVVCLVLVQTKGTNNTSVKSLKGVMGITALVSTILIWLPQIYEVYKLKGAGSLSVLMLLLQAPGALAVIIYQGILEKQQWGVWLPYLAVLVQECIILGQLLFYHLMEKRRLRNRPASEIQHLLSFDDGDADADARSDQQQHVDANKLVNEILIDPPSDDDLIETVFASDDD